MTTVTETVKRILVRFKQKDFEVIVDNWSLLRSRNFDSSVVGRRKHKFISALLDHIKVITVVNFFVEQST